MSNRIRVFALCMLLGAADVAHAQINNAGLLDKAIKQYRTVAEGWQSTALSAATTLFWSLAAISLVWTMGQLALRRAELGEFFGELIRYLLFAGFWNWMLVRGPEHAQLIIESMVKLGGGATGLSIASPSGVLDVGFQLVDRSMAQSSILGPFDAVIGCLMSLGILIVLALVSVNMLVTLIACWIVAYAGLFILGFGGSRWTSDMAINYYRMLLSLGLQVLGMILLVGVGKEFLSSYYDVLEPDVSLHEQAVLLVVSIILLVLVNRVPPLLGSLANGSSPQHAFGGGAGAAAALSTASAAGALGATATRPAVEAASLLAKAAAIGVVGGAGAAAASLLDGFRSEGERSGGSGSEPLARDAQSANSESGGSVFAAPTSNVAQWQEEGGQASRSASVSVSGEELGDATTGVGAEAQGQATGEPQVADVDDHEGHASEFSAAAAEEAADETNQHPAGQTQGAEATREMTPETEHGSDSAESARAASSADGAHSSSEARVRTALGPPGMHGPSGGRSDGAAGNVGSQSSSRGERPAEAATPTPRSAVGTPAGTFALAAPTASPAPLAAPSAGYVAPTGALSSAPAAPTIAATHSAPASTAAAPASPPPPPAGFGAQPPSSPHAGHPGPSASLAAATMRAAGSTQELPFAMATGAESANRATARAELPAAYSMREPIDVETEIAAFRDKE